MIEFITFGVKHYKIRPDAQQYISCLTFPNPHSILMEFTGQDSRVKEWLLHAISSNPRHKENFDSIAKKVHKYICIAVDNNVDLHLAFYCIGGRHRSVFVAEYFAELWNSRNVEVSVRHLNVLHNSQKVRSNVG